MNLPACPECNGHGRFIGGAPCDTCANTGTMTKDAYIERLVAERDRLLSALRCEDDYKRASQSNDWMSTLSAAGWDGRSNPRGFINALRRVALGVAK